MRSPLISNILDGRAGLKSTNNSLCFMFFVIAIIFPRAKAPPARIKKIKIRYIYIILLSLFIVIYKNIILSFLQVGRL